MKNKTNNVGYFLKKTIVASSLIALSACAVSVGNNTTNTEATVRRLVEPVLADFQANRIKADVKFLADDMLKGRDTGSEGYRIAANYVAAEYERLGLQPAGDNGTYFQEVPFQTAKLNLDTAHMSATVSGENVTFALGDDFYMGGSVANKSGVAKGQLVFVGYGIHAPDLGHDDLTGLDLDGKVAVILTGGPSTFQTEIRAHHGSATTKAKELLKRGITGLIQVNSLANEKRRPFANNKKRLGIENFDLAKQEAVGDSPRIQASAIVSHETARRLFAGAPQSFDEVLVATEAGTATSFALDTTVTLKRESILSETIYSPNVLAVLEGADPALKNEYVVLTAHLDHIGVNEKAKGDDKINNGALDNATGVSVMMEVARAYVRSGIRPRRSIIFAALTAEEKGLLGAEYFAHDPTVVKSGIVANVNLDMPVLLYDFTDVVAFGAERSSLGPIAAAAVAKGGLKLSPDPIPEEGIFTRSDHYRFVQQGIPSVFLITGFEKSTDGIDGGEMFMGFLKKQYHSPQDSTDLPIDYQAGAKFAYVNWLIATEIANSSKRPTWNKGDFFGNTFAK